MHAFVLIIEGVFQLVHKKTRKNIRINHRKQEKCQKSTIYLTCIDDFKLLLSDRSM